MRGISHVIRPSPFPSLLLVLVLAWGGLGHPLPAWGGAGADAPALQAHGHDGACPCQGAHGAGGTCEHGCPQCAQCHAAPAAEPAVGLWTVACMVEAQVARPPLSVPTLPFRPPRA